MKAATLGMTRLGITAVSADMIDGEGLFALLRRLEIELGIHTDRVSCLRT